VDDKRWWDIISVGCPRDVNPLQWDETLYAVLLTLAPDDIIRFDTWYDDRVGDAFREDIWRVARLINNDERDEGFHCFRCWLVGMGKVVFESALRSPDTLAEVLDPEHECVVFVSGVAWSVWTELTGRTDDEYWERYKAIRPDMTPILAKADWTDTPDELRRHFPRLSAMYLTNEDL
jgi:hypothetical protein